MRSNLVWGDRIVDKDGNRQPVFDLAFNPEGTQLIAACGPYVIVYDAVRGTIQETLKAHKDQVYAVSFNFDGKRFASGGADKTVIVWNNKLEPIIKYTHSDSIQCITHNPVTGQVTSGSLSDYGMWSPDQKNVNKFKVSSRILSASWTSDGQYLALGTYDGFVSVRNHLGEELMVFDRKGGQVWNLCWSPTTVKEVDDSLVTVDWNRNVTLYDKKGKSKGFKVDFDPCSVEFCMGNEMLLVGGSNRQLQVYTTDGVRIGPVCERESWIWKTCMKPKANNVAVASNDGTIGVYQFSFGVVHGMYQDKYAFREKMCSVVVNNLSTGKQTIVQCHDYIKKIAIYKSNLAIQTPNSIFLYKHQGEDYRIVQTLSKRIDCNLLVVTSENLILCLEKRLQLLNMDGEMEREWFLPALIRYIKVVGGRVRNEGLLVGLKNGDIFVVYLQNPFPIFVTSVEHSIRCLDMNQTRQRLAAVDETGTCSVIDMNTKQIIYKESGATSVAWNTEHEDLLCFSGNNFLSIKAGLLPAHTQKLSGFVVGFKGSKVFCLNGTTMSSIYVPQPASMLAYLETKRLSDAYKIACLGVTDADWKRLAMEALESMDFTIAKKSFEKIKEYKYLDLIRNLELKIREPRELLLGEIRAYQGRFQEAANLFIQAGYNQKAIDLYTDLNMWDQASKLAEESQASKTELLKKKAESQQEKKNLFEAAKTFFEVGEYAQALNIMLQLKKFDEVIAIVRKLERSEVKLLTKCVEFFNKHEMVDFAAETMFKLGNLNNLAELYANSNKWEQGLALANDYPSIAPKIHLPYALFLAQEGNYDGALEYFEKAGRNDLSREILGILLEFALDEARFEDASYLCLKISRLSSKEEEVWRFDVLSEYFFAYAATYRFVREPFTDHLPDSLFHMARFLFHADLQQNLCIYGLNEHISISIVYFALGKLSRMLGANRLGRFVSERLFDQYYIEPELLRKAKINWLSMKSMPFVDAEELLPICWSCGTTNNLLRLDKQMPGTEGYQERCQKCNIKFIHSSFSFENLGIIEIEGEPGLSDGEVEELLMTEPPKIRSPIDQASKQQNTQSLVVEFEDEIDGGETEKRISTEGREILTRDELLKVSPMAVFVAHNGSRCRFFRRALDQVRVTMCKACNKFFHTEDYELAVSRTGKCPFCKTVVFEI